MSCTRGVNWSNVKFSLPHLLQLLQVIIKTLNAPTDPWYLYKCYKRSFNDVCDVGTYHTYVRLYLISLMSRCHKKLRDIFKRNHIKYIYE